MKKLIETRVGIIGGMGNEAMVDLIAKIATIEAHHEHEFVVFGNARLAYRPEEVGEKWLPTDLPELRKYDTAVYTLRLMQYLGVDVVGLACNSAHELFRKVLLNIPLSFIDMIERTANSLEGCQDKVLVMGVDSLVDSELYQSALSMQGVTATKPSKINQQKIMEAIYNPEFGIKTAKITQQAEKLLCDVICDEIATQGCKKVVLGCTELPLALTMSRCEYFKSKGLLPLGLEVIDASMVLAKSLVVNSGFNEPLLQPLLNYQGSNLDWFSPLCFKVESLTEMVQIQNQIFTLTAEYLAAKGKSITGSYFHLPTLFFSASAVDVEQKLLVLDIPVYTSDIKLTDIIEPIFQLNYAQMVY